MSEDSKVIIYKSLKCLVTNSLNSNATSIAIRLHLGNLRLLVIDNGEGLSLDDLEHFGHEKNHAGASISFKFLRTFEKHIVKLVKHTASVVVMSRHKDNDTFGKMLTKYCIGETREIPKRPAQGTTVIFNFLPPKNDEQVFVNELMRIVAAFALNNPQVSFSFRDDETMKILFGIKKHNAPMDTLQMICFRILDPEKIQYIQNEKIGDRVITGYFGYDCSKIVIQRIFVNNREVDCGLIEDIVITNYLKTINSYGNGNGLKFGLKKDKVFFVLYINSPDYSLRNLLKDEGFLDTLELRIVRAVFLQLQTISPRMLEHIFPLKIEETVWKKPKIRRNKKFQEMNTVIQKKRLLPDLKDISLPLLNYTCRASRKSMIGYSSDNKRLNDNSSKSIVSETKKIYDVENFSLIENPDDIGDSNTELDGHDETLETKEKRGNSWDQMDLGLDDLGEWSDWIYEESQSHDFNQQTYYKFLPQKLRMILPIRRKQQLTRRAFFNRPKEIGIFKWNRAEHKIEQTHLPRRQDSHVRPCKNSQKRIEITLEKEVLKNLKVLNQVNKEFIAGVTYHDDKKYLILMDQHAMDERIRYESLLREYRCNQNALLLSYLYRPLEIPDLPDKIMSSIIKNSLVLKRFGVTLKQRNKNSVLVSTVPNCFSSKKYKNQVYMINSVKELIIEIGENLISRSGTKCLPIAIHNAIASEACHGAIRFGDVLTTNQCGTLVSYWIDTDLPNRCAHGRPAVVPLMEINDYNRRYQQVFKGKLNFGALKKRVK